MNQCEICGNDLKDKRFTHLVIGSVGLLHALQVCCGCNNEMRKFHRMLRAYHQIEGNLTHFEVQ